MTNYTKTAITPETPRTELHDALGLTGAEVSITKMAAGTEVPFYHAHKENEEIYGIISGNGSMEIDGEKVELKAGDWMRVSPKAMRRLHADTDMTVVCIQAKEGSLTQWTMADAIV